MRSMPRRLQDDEETVRVEVKMPKSLRAKALTMASSGDRDGDLASFMRWLIKRAWREHEKTLEKKKP